MLNLLYVVFMCVVMGFMLSMVYRFVLAHEKSAETLDRIANRFEWPNGQ